MVWKREICAGFASQPTHAAPKYIKQWERDFNFDSKNACVCSCIET